MESKHLTDSEIQDYLDGNSGTEWTSISQHLPSCKLCKRKLEQYRSLYAGLEDQTGFELPDGFADRVASAVGLEEREPFLQRHVEALISLAGAIAAIAALLVFTDMAELIVKASWFGWLDSFLASRAFATARHYAGNAAGLLNLIVSGTLALLTVWVIDRFIIRLRRGPSSLII
jgi:anti-sigma factor RsiW